VASQEDLDAMQEYMAYLRGGSKGQGRRTSLFPSTASKGPGIRSIPARRVGIDPFTNVAGGASSAPTGYPIPQAPQTPFGAVASAPSPANPYQMENNDDAMLALAGATIGLGTGDERAADAQGDVNQGQAMLDAPLPEGRQAGRVYVAASPLEAIGAALKMRKGYRLRKHGEETRGEIRDKQDTSRAKAMSEILRVMGRKPRQETPDWADMGNR